MAAIYLKLPCPVCGGKQTTITDTRKFHYGTYRRLRCRNCGIKFSHRTRPNEPDSVEISYKHWDVIPKPMPPPPPPPPPEPVQVKKPPQKLLKGELESIAARMAHLLRVAIYDVPTEQQRENAYTVLNEWEDAKKRLLG